MADTASLVVRVSAKGVTGVDRDLKGLSNTSLKAERSSISMSKSLGAIAPVALAVGAAIGGTSAAMSAMVLNSAASERELTNLSRTAKTTREDFAALSFVFKQYGVDAKGTADAMNDVSERLGEFAAAGTGPFQDFADVLGLTKAEAVSMADELQRLKPEDVIKRMVQQMEAAGTQGAQMSFVLKSMSNDLEYASGAFSDNGKEIDALKKKYTDFNSQLMLNQGQLQQLNQTAQSFDLLTASFGNASNVVSATLAPTLDSFFNSVISTVPNATNTIVDFINTFNSAADIQAIDQIDRQMASLADTIENGVAKGYDKMSRDMRENPLDFVRVGKYQDAVARLSELEQQKNKILSEQNDREMELAKTRAAGQISSGVGKEATKVSTKDSDAQKAQASAYIETLRQSNLTEMELIDVQEQQKQAKVAEYRAKGLIDEQAYQEALDDIQLNAVVARAAKQTELLDAESKNRDDIRKAELAAESESQRQKEKMIDDGIDAQRNMTTNLKSALGEQNAIYKASAIATATIDTYKAATGAYAAMASIPYVGPVLGAVAAGAAVVAGLANVNAIRNAREQGGGMRAGQDYNFAERGKTEVVVPAGASRARTAAQMKDIMGQNGGSNAIAGVTIINNTTGKIDSASTEVDQEGMLRVIIDEHVANALLSQDSSIAKARKASAGQPGF